MKEKLHTKSDVWQGYAACLICEAKLTGPPHHHKNHEKEKAPLTWLFYEEG